MNCTDKYVSLYNAEPEYQVFCPYRVCPLGAHSDHQFGKVTGFAIDKGVHIAFSPDRSGVIEASSLQFRGRVRFHVNNVPETKENDWADYLRGVTAMLGEIRHLHTGVLAVIEGTLPIGGLSSSAAVCIAFAKALCIANSITLSDSELLNVCLSAENKYVGVSCGKLDQSCEIYCRRDSLLYLDTLDDSYECIPESKNSKPYEIMILFSGLERSLAGSKFNMRVDECKSAAYALEAFSGTEYGKFCDTYLRNVPREVYETYKDRLPAPWARRAEHWYSEYERVGKGVEAWRNGDLDAFGKLVFESGYSSIVNYETGSPELKKLYEIMTGCDGIYGGRFSGAGFKGCCMALVDPSYREYLEEKITKEYLGEYPALTGKFSVHFCNTAEGVHGDRI